MDRKWPVVAAGGPATASGPATARKAVRITDAPHRTLCRSGVTIRQPLWDWRSRQRSPSKSPWAGQKKTPAPKGPSLADLDHWKLPKKSLAGLPRVSFRRRRRNFLAKTNWRQKHQRKFWIGRKPGEKFGRIFCGGGGGGGSGAKLLKGAFPPLPRVRMTVVRPRRVPNRAPTVHLPSPRPLWRGQPSRRAQETRNSQNEAT